MRAFLVALLFALLAPHRADACQATDDSGVVVNPGTSGNSAHCSDGIANTQDICVSPITGDTSSNGCLSTHPTVSCTSDACNTRTLSGPGWHPQCSSTPINNGGTCSDGNPNTYADKCASGTCTGTPCSTCAMGNYVSTACGTANTVCAACPTGCTSCTSATACTACAAGFVLDGGACKPCSTCAAGTYQTAACTPTADTTCATCASACGAGSYEATLCTPTTDRSCAACPDCTTEACTGAKKVCLKDTICRITGCTGTDCKAPAGTSCTPLDVCATTGTCDDSGACVPATGLPDGTPCEMSDCALVTQCFGNACTCGEPTMGTPDAGTPDAGTAGTPKKDDGGCSFGATPSAGLVPLLAIALVLAAIVARRRRA